MASRKHLPTETAPASGRSRAKAAKPVELPADPSAKIRQQAYFNAERRGFAPGHDLEDWLEAERTVQPRFDV